MPMRRHANEQEMHFQSLDQEDALKEEMTTYSNILFFFFFLFTDFYFYLFIFYFTILYWFCHTSTCIHHGCTHVPHPEPLSHLPPHTIPLGHPSAPTPSFLYPVFLPRELHGQRSYRWCTVRVVTENQR